MKLLSTVVALVAATAVAAPADNIKREFLDTSPHQDDPAFISAVMRAHWYWRRLHCAQDLVWDPKLADAARKDIEECTHHPGHKRPGSNLSSVSGAPKKHEDWIEFARTATHGWHEEEIKYPYDNPSFQPAWGHFTQMVWRNTTRIGCALGECNAKGPDAVQWPGRFYCYYEFFGNNVAAGQFEMQVWGPVCRDPAVAEVSARENIQFDWTDNKKALAAAVPL